MRFNKTEINKKNLIHVWNLKNYIPRRYLIKIKFKKYDKFTKGYFFVFFLIEDTLFTK